MAQLAASNDVTLEAVESSERHWNYKSQGLTTLAAAVIAVAVAAATAGSSLGASLAGVSSTTATGAAANAGMASLISQAAISLIDNQGDIGKTLTQLGSLNTVKAMALSMAEAGALSEIGTLTDGHFTAAGVTRNGGLTPMRYLASGQGLENVLGHAAVGCAAGMASGGSCGSNAAAAALSDAASPLTIDAGFAGGTALSAGIGAGTSAITGGSAAIGAITGAEGYLYNQVDDEGDSKPNEPAQPGDITYGVAKGVVDTGEAIRKAWDWLFGDSQSSAQGSAYNPNTPFADSIAAESFLSPDDSGATLNNTIDNELGLRTAPTVEGTREAATTAGSTLDDASSLYNTSITRAGSRYLNAQTDVDAAEFQKNLISNGYNVVKQSEGATVLSNGMNTWTIYTRASTAGLFNADRIAA